MTEISDLTTSCRFQNTLDKDIPKIEPATEADKRFDDKTQRFDNVEQFTADAAGICKKRQRRHDRTRRPSVSPIKPVRLKIQRGSKGNVIEGPQVVAKTRQTHQDADLSNIKTASAINADVKWLESQTICNSEKLTAEWVSVAEFHRLNKLGNTESEYTGNTESETGNKKSETLTLVDQPKPLGSGRVKSYVEKINSDIHSKEKEIQGNIKDKIKDTVNNYLETAIDRTPKKVKKQYYLGPKPFKSQNSIDRCGPSLQYEKSETTVIDHITEQSIANRDELVVKSKSETKFVDLSDQFGLDEHTLSTAKNNVLNSKLVNYLDKEPDKDKVEILSNYDHDLPVRLEDNLDTAEADSPETNSQTFPFKVEAENRTESSVNDKNDCELMSQTVVKPRSDETENNFAETVRYAAPQHANESYESNGSKELTGSRLYGGNSAYLNSFIRKNHGKHRKEGIKLSSIGTLNSEKTVKHSGDFAFTNPENNVKSIYTHSDATDIKTDTVKDILNRENKRSFLENLGPFLDNNGKLSDVEINCDSQSGPAIVGMFQDNQVTSLKHDLEPHTLGDEWRSGGQIENVHVSEAERNREKIVKDDRDFSTTEIKQTPNHDWQGARPKDPEAYQPGIRTKYRYPARSHSGVDHGHQYAAPILDSATQPGWKSDDSFERRGSQSQYSGVSCDCSFHLNRAKPISGNLSGHKVNRTSESNQSYLTGLSEGPMCRICQDGDDQEVLVSPCYCAGSLGLLHVSCLQKWLGASNKTNCEICGFEFMVERKPMPISHFIRDPGTVADRRNIICDMVCVSLISPLTVVTSYLCVSGAMKYYVIDSWERNGLLILSGVLMGLYLIWLMVMLKHNYNLWRDWKMFHQEVTLLAAPKMNVGNDSCRAQSKDPAGSCRSKSTITSSIDKVKLQSVKISVCGPIGRHTAKDSFGSSGLSPGPGKCHQQMKSLPNLPPIYRSPSSKGSTKRSSQSPSSSQILSSNRSRHQQTPSKCSILTPVHEWQNIRGNVRAKCLVKQENLESDLQKDKRDLVESLGAGSSQPSPAKYRHRGLRNIEHNHVSNLNAGLRSGFKQERRVLRSERGKLSDGMKRNSQNSYRSPALAQAIDTIVRKSPENAELSSIICIYKQTKNKDDDTVDSEKRQRIETKGMTAVKGDQQFTDSEVFSRGNSPVGQHAGIKSERSQNQIQIDFSSDNQPEKASKLVQHDPSLVCKPADINPTSINNDFNTGTEQATRREPDSKANNA